MSGHDRMSDVFLRACALRPAERAAFLDEACTGDPALRTEVEAMLAADARAQAGEGSGILDARVGEVADTLLPQPPQWIGPYRVLGLLGEGGMGVVYRAEQHTPVRREVALKLMRAGFESAGAVARFGMERQALAQMEHPSIARLFDAGATDDGRPYFVMELVRGTPITEHCRSEGLGVHQRISLFLDVCRALRHAHRRGVIHRDLKPSNILVERVGDRPVPKVIDFGIAKALGESALGTEFRTRTGQVIGTLEYMSPEQATGRVDAVDTRSDVYALGGVLYELIADQPPQEIAGLPLHEAVRRIVQEPPKPLPGKDGDLATIVGKCLEKEPERRYGSAAELTEDLERTLDSRPILARPPSTMYQFRKLVGRHRAGFAVAGLALAFLLVFSVTVSVQLASQRRERARAEAEARKADRVTEFLRDAFKAAREDRGFDATVKQTLDAAALRLEQGRGEDAEADVAIRQTLGEAYSNFGEYGEAERLLREAMAMQERRLGASHPDVGLAHRLLAAGLLQGQKGKEAEREARIALRIQEEQPKQDLHAIAIDLGLLGDILVFENDERAAGDLTRRQIRIYESMPQDARTLESLADAKERLAAITQESGALAESEAMVRDVLTLRRRAAANAPTIALGTTLARLATVLGDSGRCQDAEPFFREALEITRQLRGPRHVQVGNVLHQRSTCLADVHRFDEAEADLEEAASIAMESVGRQSQTYVEVLKTLDRVYSGQGRLDDALRVSRESLALAREVAGDSSPYVAERWRRLAGLLELKGLFSEAESAHRAPLPIAEMLPSDDLQVAWIVGAFANYLIGRGRFDEARPFHDRVFSIVQEKLDPAHPVLAVVKIWRAALLDGLGQFSEGEKLRNEGMATLRGLFDDRHDWLAYALQHRAHALHRQGRLDEALMAVQDAVARLRQLVTPNDSRLAAALLDLAENQASSGASSRAAAREALTIWTAIEYADAPRMARARALASN